MGFEPVRRSGRYWEDAKKLDKFISKFPFHTTGKCELDFEKGFASALMVNKDDFNADVITQIDKSTSVQSVHCFGKRHRPDMTLGDNIIAIELKFITYAGLKEAIGQGYLYRLRYKYVFLILIISEERKTIYESLDTDVEKDLEDLLRYLSWNMNIFTYIAPAFNIKPGMKKIHSFFE